MTNVVDQILDGFVNHTRAGRSRLSILHVLTFALSIAGGIGSETFAADAQKPMLFSTPSSAASGGLVSWPIGALRHYILRLRTTVSMRRGAELLAFTLE